MDSYFKLLGVLVSVLGLAVLLRQKNSVISIGFTLSIFVFCIGVILPQIISVWRAIEDLVFATGLEMDLFVPLMKVVGISICTRLTAEICRDAGERAFGAKIELAGAVAALLCALPLAQKVLELITGVVP